MQTNKPYDVVVMNGDGNDDTRIHLPKAPLQMFHTLCGYCDVPSYISAVGDSEEIGHVNCAECISIVRHCRRFPKAKIGV